MSHTYAFPRPSLTVDAVVFGLGSSGLEVLLVRRGEAPFRGMWALPGGFVHEHEPVAEACRRELAEETGVRGVYLEELRTFSSPGRDPRGWTVTVAHVALVPSLAHAAIAGTDAAAASWVPVDQACDLAFDHDEILAVAREHIRDAARRAPLGFSLLPRRFTLSALQRVYEAVLGRSLDKRNFRRKILETGLLRATGDTERGAAHRPSALFSFDARAHARLQKSGFTLDLLPPLDPTDMSTALLLVDVQNDFLPGGRLAVPRGDEVVPVANAWMQKGGWSAIVATQDFHPAGHESFASSHPGKAPYDVVDLHGLPQVLWPDHCVEHTGGAAFAPGLLTALVDRVFPKGTDRTVDSYSGFFDNGKRKGTGLVEFLRARGVDAVVALGLATDYCVRATALDAVALGFRTSVVTAGCRAVNVTAGDGDAALAELVAHGVTLL